MSTSCIIYRTSNQCPDVALDLMDWILLGKQIFNALVTKVLQRGCIFSTTPPIASLGRLVEAVREGGVSTFCLVNRLVRNKEYMCRVWDRGDAMCDHNPDETGECAGVEQTVVHRKHGAGYWASSWRECWVCPQALLRWFVFQSWISWRRCFQSASSCRLCFSAEIYSWLLCSHSGNWYKNKMYF